MHHNHFGIRIRCASRKCGLVAVLILGTLLFHHSSHVKATDFTNWAHSAVIAVDGYIGNEPLDDFPALVVLSTNRPGFNYADFSSPTGADLRISDSTGTNELSYEIESWRTNSESYVWVRVPSLVTNQLLIAYWGNPAATNPATYTVDGTVWANGFGAVWHLGEPSGTRADSSGHTVGASPLGPVGSVTQTNGMLGFATQLDGNGGYLNAGNDLLAGTQGTLSAWVKLDQGNSSIIGPGVSDEVFAELYVRGSPGEVSHYVHITDMRWRYQTDGSLGNLGEWHHIAAVQDGVEPKIYVDGVLVPQSFAEGSISNRTDYFDDMGGGVTWLLGASQRDDVTKHFHGVLDEVRVESVPRSSNWIWACYQNQASNDTFLTWITYTISGSITYGGQQTGEVWVIASSSSNMQNVVGSTAILEPGDYAVIVDASGDYWAHAYRDSNANGTQDFWEARGSYAGNPVSVTMLAPGIDILLADPDGDGDGMPDWWEVEQGLNVSSNDAASDLDGDALHNRLEYQLGYLANTNDTDGDSVTDGDEYLIYGSGALNVDTDGDGMDDGWEVANGLNPIVNDADGDADFDWVSNLEESNRGMNPQLADSEGDDTNDYLRVQGEDGYRYSYDRRDRLIGVESSRGLSIGYQYDGNDNLLRRTYLDRDGDDDGLLDLWEFLSGLSWSDGAGSQSAFGNADGDRYSNFQEEQAGSDPTDAASNPDTQGVPGRTAASVTVPFTPSNFVMGVGQLDGSGGEEIVVAADGTPGQETNSIFILTESSLGWSTQVVEIGTVGITSIAVGQPADTSEAAVYLGLRTVGDSNVIMRLHQNAGTWEKTPILASTRAFLQNGGFENAGTNTATAADWIGPYDKFARTNVEARTGNSSLGMAYVGSNDWTETIYQWVDTSNLPTNEVFTFGGWLKVTDTMTGAVTRIAFEWWDATNGTMLGSGGSNTYTTTSNTWLGIGASGAKTNDSFNYARCLVSILHSSSNTVVSNTAYFDDMYVSADLAPQAEHVGYVLGVRENDVVVQLDREGTPSQALFSLTTTDSAWQTTVLSSNSSVHGLGLAQLESEIGPSVLRELDAGRIEILDAVVPINGLVAYYPLAGHAADASGAGNHGSVIGAVATTDRLGTPESALLFDGVADYIDLGALDQGANAKTWTVWAKSNQPGSEYPASSAIMGNANNLGSQGMTLRVNYTTDAIDAIFGGSAIGLDAPTPLDTNWHHYAVTYDAGTTRLYVDGSIVDEVSGWTLAATPQNLELGRDTWDSGRYWAGKIDDVAIYNRALPGDDVFQAYSSGYPTEIIQDFASTNALLWRGRSMAIGHRGGDPVISRIYVDDNDDSGNVSVGDDIVLQDYAYEGGSWAPLRESRRRLSLDDTSPGYGIANVRLAGEQTQILYTGEPEGAVYSWPSTSPTSHLQRQVFSQDRPDTSWHQLAACDVLSPGEALVGLAATTNSPAVCQVVIWEPQVELWTPPTYQQTAPRTRIMPDPHTGGGYSRVALRIWDAEGNSCLPVLQYLDPVSSDWKDAAIVELDGLAYALAMAVEAMPTGTLHELLWHSAADLGTNFSGTVSLRAQSVDMADWGDWSEVLTYHVVVTNDSDGDGMLDDYETAHGLDPTRETGEDGPDGDPDGDGVLNIFEHAGDTDPRDDQSFLAITGLWPTTGGLRIDWQGGVLSRQYLEYADELQSTGTVWHPIYTNPPPTSIEESVLDMGATNRSLIYRIKAARE